MIKKDIYMKQILPFIDKDIVKVMTGLRRSGKTTMLKLIQEELLDIGKKQDHMLSINFESKLLPFHKDVDAVYQYIKDFILKDSHKKYLFFDEIQDLDKWETMINACMINAKLLSNELSTYLSGRYVEIKVYPFSFKEVKEILKEQEIYENDSSIFQKYLGYGGMPFIYQNRIENVQLCNV